MDKMERDLKEIADEEEWYSSPFFFFTFPHKINLHIFIVYLLSIKLDTLCSYAAF